MLFNSLNFIIFFPIVLIIYWLIPMKLRCGWLLIASWFFYACFDIRCLPVLLGITIITYSGGLLFNNDKNRNKVIAICLIVLCLANLVIFKYLTFFENNIFSFLSSMGVSFSLPAYSLVAPAGISFYTFKAISYVADLYNGKRSPERNLLNYALYLAFFPQIVAGPIDRAGSLLEQIKKNCIIDEEDIRTGALLMLFGYFEKIIVADRISIIVDGIYENYSAFSGAAIIFATVCYGIQIYTDFAGYSYLSIGAARILGFRVADNFKQPYFAVDIRDFWKRWHISMSEWFRDYVYIPLGGGRRGRRKKLINNMVTFLLSGLWHGASWNFVVWGGLHGLFHLVSDLTKDLRQTVNNRFNTGDNNFGRRLFKMLFTFIMVDYAWMFFRAGSLGVAIDMTKRIVTDLRLYSLSFEFITSLGLSGAQLNMIVMALLIIVIVDVLREKKLNIIRWLDEQGVVFRWLCYICSALTVLLAAVQNLGQSTGEFIYFRF